jgi:hypothetical protein
MILYFDESMLWKQYFDNWDISIDDYSTNFEKQNFSILVIYTVTPPREKR